jgi:hypothetical protein
MPSSALHAHRLLADPDAEFPEVEGQGRCVAASVPEMAISRLSNRDGAKVMTSPKPRE